MNENSKIKKSDLKVFDNYVLYKQEQPDFQEVGNWQDEFELD